MNIKKRLKKFAINYLDMYPYRRYMTKHNCVFIHIPKAAGTSILKALNGSNEFVPRDHCTALDFVKADRQKFEKCFSFSFVREPVDRIQSVYRYLAGGGNKTTNLEISKKINTEFDNFDEFVDGFIDSSNIFCNKLLMPQFHYVCDLNGDIIVNKICKFESLNNEFSVVCDKLGIHEELKLVNPSEREKVPVDELTKEKIKFIYKKDYEYFYPEN